MRKLLLLLCFLSLGVTAAMAEDGYRLWLRYVPVSDPALLKSYQLSIKAVHADKNSATLLAAADELKTGLKGLLGKDLNTDAKGITDGLLLVGTPATSAIIKSLKLETQLGRIGNEGFLIRSLTLDHKKITVITGNTATGVLYGTFHFLRLLQSNQSISALNVLEFPKLKIRVLNHWDNLDRTVERGYAGFSIWKWQLLPGYIDPRYRDYARANASVGINGTVLTNVNANALVLTKEYLLKIQALANVFRPYGIKVYLPARFSAPIEIGGLKTADPLDTAVQGWWKKKVDEIYQYVPDFGGFVVKANSEGQPGPQDYKRTHADGANMLADAVLPHQGIIMWRAFVYSHEQPDDRFKQAYNEFKGLDGKFRSNVLLQVKNGPIDFQPREPFSPLFGAMPKTPLMMEFQITQEYLGQTTHLLYQAPLYKEVLDADTYTKGKGTTVAKIIEGVADDHTLTGIAGVANIGDDINWTGHPFAQANWYAFGRLAWNPELSAGGIAEEWIRMTFSNAGDFVKPVKEIMLNSRENLVNYMTPLGLHHIMGWSHHYGPGPWIKDKPRADWTAVYYHKADQKGIGFDRTATGSNALAQYAPEVGRLFADTLTCPPEYLLWFHHLPWNYKLKTGETLWDGLCNRYQLGAESVGKTQQEWAKLGRFIDAGRYNQVKMLLGVQRDEAWWWHDACLAYFQSISGLPYPKGVTKPAKTLKEYESQVFHFVPGN